MKKLTSILALVLLVSLACSDDGATGSTGLSVQAVTSSGSDSAEDLVATDDGGEDYTLESAYLHIRDIELDLPSGLTCDDIEGSLGGGAACDDSEPGDDSVKVVIDGPFEVDLVLGTTTPSLEAVEIPTLEYTRIDFRVDDNSDDVSFAVTAGFQHGGEALTLDLSLDFNEDIRIEDANGILVTEDTDLVAEFVVDNWLAGVDIGACIDDGDVIMEGTTVVISESSTSGDCSNIEDTIKDNMKNSGQLDRQ